MLNMNSLYILSILAHTYDHYIKKNANFPLGIMSPVLSSGKTCIFVNAATKTSPKSSTHKNQIQKGHDKPILVTTHHQLELLYHTL